MIRKKEYKRKKVDLTKAPVDFVGNFFSQVTVAFFLSRCGIREIKTQEEILFSRPILINLSSKERIDLVRSCDLRSLYQKKQILRNKNKGTSSWQGME